MLGASAEEAEEWRQSQTQIGQPGDRQTEEIDSQVTSTDQLKKTKKAKKEERGKVGQANTHTHSREDLGDTDCTDEQQSATTSARSIDIELKKKKVT